MLQLFASATVVASVVIALASGGLRLSYALDLETQYLLTSLWCLIPLTWGFWALMTPKSWLPQRLPLWGAVLGAAGGFAAGFILDLPSRLAGQPLPTWWSGIAVALAVGGYYLLWMLVRRAYGIILRHPSA